VAVTITAGTPYVSSGSASSASTNVPGRSAGDVSFIAAFCSTSSATADFYVLNGWTTLFSAYFKPTGLTTGCAIIYWRAWQPGDPTSVTVDVASTSRIVCLPFLVKGADTVAPIESSAGTPYGLTAAATDVGAPSLAGRPLRLLVSFYGARPATSGVTATWSQPTGMTELLDASSTSGSLFNAVAAVDYQVLTAAGATGVRNARCTQQSNPIGHSMVIRPPVGTPEVGVLRTQAGPVEMRRKTV
jgi:hypothetical protein